jgi:Haem-binding domain
VRSFRFSARFLRRLLIVSVVAVVAAQFVPVTRTNPPVESQIHAAPEVDRLLRRACYDCHSNETVWPWYSRVAPVSWVVAHDVNEGREHLNFSTWGRLTSEKQVEAVRKIWEEVSEGAMPPLIYLPAHPRARLTDQDKAALEAWAAAVR